MVCAADERAATAGAPAAAALPAAAAKDAIIATESPPAANTRPAARPALRPRLWIQVSPGWACTARRLPPDFDCTFKTGPPCPLRPFGWSVEPTLASRSPAVFHDGGGSTPLPDDCVTCSRRYERCAIMLTQRQTVAGEFTRSAEPITPSGGPLPAAAVRHRGPAPDRPARGRPGASRRRR